MTLLTRRGALIAGVAGSGLALVWLHEDPPRRQADRQRRASSACWPTAEALDHGQPALPAVRRRAGPRVQAVGHLAELQGQRHPASRRRRTTPSAVDEDFANWRLLVDGLVARPLSLRVAELRALPARTQITRHDCVEGWSAIGQWTGVPLGLLLKAAGVLPAGEIRGVPLRRQPGGRAGQGRRAGARASTTRASRWWTPSIPRP